MEFVTGGKALSDALAAITDLAGTRSTVADCEDVLIEADEVVRLTATDLRSWLAVVLPGADVRKPGRTLVAADRLRAVAQASPEGPLTVNADENLLNVQVGRYNASLAVGVDPDSCSQSQWPEIKAMSPIVVPATILSRAVKGAFYAASKMDAAYVMAGMMIGRTPSGQLQCAATDGRMAARCRVATDVPEGFESVMLPRAGVKVLQSVLEGEEGDVQILQGRSSMQFETEQFRLLTQMLEGRIPPVDSIVPKVVDSVAQAQVSPEAWLRAIKQVMAAGKGEDDRLTLTVRDGVLRMQLQSQHGRGESEVECENSAPFTVGFDGGLLKKILQAATEDQVMWHWFGEESPNLFLLGEDREAILMPWHREKEKK